MADIVIRGMELPKTCCECDLKTYDPEKIWNDNGVERIGVWVCKRTREIIWNTQRGEECPLAPMPERHGRLGDLDTAEAILHNKAFDLANTSGEHDGVVWALRQIKALPTILEAEGGADNG